MIPSPHMSLALIQARAAAARGEVPVGAVIIAPDGSVAAQAGNRTRADHDPTAHAEILALRAACRAVGSERLPGYRLFVTLEPCPMCAGALVAARISRLVFGAREPREGAIRSLYQLADDPRRTHQIEVREGVLADESALLLRSFFQTHRE